MGVVLDGLSRRSFWGSRGTHVLQVDGARTIGSGVSNNCGSSSRWASLVWEGQGWAKSMAGTRGIGAS